MQLRTAGCQAAPQNEQRRWRLPATSSASAGQDPHAGQCPSRDPRTLPAKALNFAQFDALQVLNKLMDTTRLRESMLERVVNRALALPVSHFLRMKRGFSLPVLDRRGDGSGEIGWGTYQSPILVQWKGTQQRTRALDVKLVRFV